MNPAFQQFITPDAIDRYARHVDPSGNESVLASLGQLSPEELIGKPLTDLNMASCCKSGLWLLHNFLHKSHDISQSMHTAEGSWWHAIMHRTEGDFGNSKYWYRQVGEHEAFGEIGQDFDPYSFVDRCEKEYRQGTLTDETQQVAFAEWKALFDYCQQNAG
jgi:hypothetical protein